MNTLRDKDECAICYETAGTNAGQIVKLITAPVVNGYVDSTQESVEENHTYCMSCIEEWCRDKRNWNPKVTATQNRIYSQNIHNQRNLNAQGLCTSPMTRNVIVGMKLIQEPQFCNIKDIGIKSRQEIVAILSKKYNVSASEFANKRLDDMCKLVLRLHRGQQKTATKKAATELQALFRTKREVESKNVCTLFSDKDMTKAELIQYIQEFNTLVPKSTLEKMLKKDLCKMAKTLYKEGVRRKKDSSKRKREVSKPGPWDSDESEDDVIQPPKKKQRTKYLFK